MGNIAKIYDLVFKKEIQNTSFPLYIHYKYLIFQLQLF